MREEEYTHPWHACIRERILCNELVKSFMQMSSWTFDRGKNNCG